MYPCSNPELVAAVSAAGRDRRRAADLAHLRARPRLPRRAPADPPAHRRQADRDERPHRAVLEDLPRAHGALGRRSRSRRACASSSRRSATRAGSSSACTPRAASSTTTSPSGSGRGRRVDGGVDGLIAVNARPAATPARASARALFDELGASRAARWSARAASVTQRDFVRRAAPGLRRRAARHALHRDDRVPGERRLQAGHRGGQRGRHRAHRAAHGRAGGGDPTRRTSSDWAHGRRRSPAGCCAAADASSGCGRSTRCASLWQLKRASLREAATDDYWQAGKSVAGIDAIEPASEVVTTVPPTPFVDDSAASGGTARRSPCEDRRDANSEFALASAWR